MDSAHARAERAYSTESRPGQPVRRTVQIRGQVAPPPRRRSPAAAQISARPDRVAMWAVMLGLFLVFMAVITATP